VRIKFGTFYSYMSVAAKTFRLKLPLDARVNNSQRNRVCFWLQTLNEFRFIVGLVSRQSGGNGQITVSDLETVVARNGYFFAPEI
jgi:hypothetical protein